MRPEVARARLREVAERYPVITLIQFIGGEPLLNPSTIEAVCVTAHELVRIGALSQMPKLGVVTNLTVLPQTTLDLLREYAIDVVASLDGPPEVHDSLRRTAADGATHATVVRHLAELSQADIGLEIEATYTRLHLAHEISIVELLKYFSRWSPSISNITPVMTGRVDPLGVRSEADWQAVMDLERDALNYTIDEWHQGNFVAYGLFIEIARTLMAGEDDRASLFCPAGFTNLAVAADGDLYACHVLTNNSGYRLAGGQDGPVRESNSTHIPTKSNFGECSSCWAKRWCKVCIGRMEMYSPGSPRPPAENCVRTRRAIELVLQRLPYVLDMERIAPVAAQP
jgi:uncharacterized protein